MTAYITHDPGDLLFYIERTRRSDPSLKDPDIRERNIRGYSSRKTLSIAYIRNELEWESVPTNGGTEACG